MDKIPFKSSGRSSKADETVYTEPSQPEKPIRITPPVTATTETVVMKEGYKPTLLILAVVALYVLIVVIAIAVFLPKGQVSVSPVVDTSKYQAVTLANGDIYIGKMTFESSDYAVLKDVFYLSPIAPGSDSNSKTGDSTTKQNFNLNKFTEIAYNPDDEMTIPRSQITHFENLKSGGKVAQLISQYKKQN